MKLVHFDTAKLVFYSHLLVGLLALLVFQNGHSQPRKWPVKPELFVIMAPKQDARIQQQIIQQVRLESAFRFDRLRVDLGQIEGAEVIELQAPATRAFENWGVEGFVYETTRAIFAQRSGTLVIPAITAFGRITNHEGIEISFTHTVDAVAMPIKGPAIEMLNEPWLVANEVKLSESWSKNPDDLKVGEIAQRTITAEVKGALAEQIPPLIMSIGTGIQVLPGKITRQNTVTPRGTMATFSQQFDVRIASDQLSDIPPVQLAWWNAVKQRSERSAVRGWRIEPVLPERGEMISDLLEQAQQEQQYSRLMLALVMLPLIVFTLVAILVIRRNLKWSATLARLSARVANRLLGPATTLPAIGFTYLNSKPAAGQSSPAHSAAND